MAETVRRRRAFFAMSLGPLGWLISIAETKGHSLEQVEEHGMKGGRPREL
jgi:hypothetical protein